MGASTIITVNGTVTIVARLAGKVADNMAQGQGSTDGNASAADTTNSGNNVPGNGTNGGNSSGDAGGGGAWWRCHRR